MFLSARDADYPDQGPQIVGVSTGLMGLAFVLVVVRLVYRLRSSGVRADDYLILAAVLLSLGHSINDCITVVYYGYGKHKVDLTPAQAYAGKQTGAALGFWIMQIFYKLSLMCTKLSVCLLYRRIFERAKRSFNLSLWAVTGLIFFYYVAGVLTTIFECTPVTKSWIKTEPGTCISTSAFFYANAAFNIFTDLIVMALPIPIIYELHLPTRQKVMLCCVFAVGLVATATSIIRIFTIEGTKDPDTTWGVSGSVLWSSAEINTAIICACLPMLRPPLQALFPRLFRSGNSTGSGGRYGPKYGSDKYGSGNWAKSASSGNRFSRRQSRRVPDPNSVTVVMDEIENRHSRRYSSSVAALGPAGARPGAASGPRSEKSSDDEPYFMDRDDDGTGILKRTDVTVVYEAEAADEERNRRRTDKDFEAGLNYGAMRAQAHADTDRIQSASQESDSTMPGMAL